MIPPQTLDIFKLNTLRALLGGEFPAIIDLFANQLPVHAAQLRAAMANGDGTALAAQAHALKGSAANLGACEVSRVAAEIERLARRCEPWATAPALAALPLAVSQTLAALRDAGYWTGRPDGPQPQAFN